MLTETTFLPLSPEPSSDVVSHQEIENSIEELSIGNATAALADKRQPLPLVAMTHGDTDSRYNVATAAEYLASSGYIVIAPEHTGNCPFL
jgi:predicted dienelactone hydrolase